MATSNPFMMILRASLENKTSVTLILGGRDVSGVVIQADNHIVELQTETGRVLLRADAVEGVAWNS